MGLKVAATLSEYGELVMAGEQFKLDKVELKKNKKHKKRGRSSKSGEKEPRSTATLLLGESYCPKIKAILDEIKMEEQ
jgi:hypothetical protein